MNKAFKQYRFFGKIKIMKSQTSLFFWYFFFALFREGAGLGLNY